MFDRDEDALSELRRAAELDPFSSRFNVSWATILFFMRQYDRGIDQFQKTLELDPNYGRPHEWLGYAYEKKGMQKETIAEWSRALNLSGANEEASMLDHAYARSGFEAAVGPWCKNDSNNSMRKPLAAIISPPQIRYRLRAFGRQGPAFAWLAKAAAERNRFALEINVNPMLDPLRPDSRFEKIANQIIPAASK